MSEQVPVQTFVVGIDREAVLRRREAVRAGLRRGAWVTAGIGALGIGIAGYALVAFQGSGMWPFMVLLIASMVPLLASTALALRLVKDRERWFAANELQPVAMRMSPKALELACEGGSYAVMLPWESVQGFQQVKVFGQYVLELRLQRGVGATTAGVRGLDQPAVRAVVKPHPLLKPTGMFAVNALDQPIHVIDQALQHYSAGKTAMLR